jgi:cephalosporin hydroxylase
MTFDREQFERDKLSFLSRQDEDEVLRASAVDLITKMDRHNYEYQWTWLGLPMIQMPEDIVLAQEIIWETKPDFIVETGIAWGGSVVYYASLLQLIGHGEVVVVDTVLPQKNVDKIMAYPFSHRIRLIKGSSTDPDVFVQIKNLLHPNDKVMVVLDSNHTHEHVYNELKLYSQLIRPGQYLVAQDTLIERIPHQEHRPRPWGHGNNPLTAVRQFLSENEQFTNKTLYNRKALISCHKDGYIGRNV